ncbi:uncharacterized protein PRCAT00004081001 [Priceomyces carsonii]|uniref:uncharacterized protein n=1 Tax=Priceomyces carsonii TaxID=28549 RepID=UPI002EDB8ED9|nr:unnamed protein product [Priceomyces carsonii]
MVKYHLIVLVHGIWGNSSHLGYIEKQLEHESGKNREEDELIVVYKTGSHAGYMTYDGIDVNGKRISDEIWDVTNELNQDGNVVSKFSIVGYSLGGLISRYAIGVLFSQSYFRTIEPVNFVTFCTPHVGILNPCHGFSVSMFNKVVPHLLAHTGNQLFLKKSANLVDKEKRLPLLVWMTDPKSYFFKGLAGFRRRTLYANVINDKRTSFFTSYISKIDPFNSYSNNDPSILDLSYIKNYEPTVIDISKSVGIRQFPVDKKIKRHSKVSLLTRVLYWSKVVFNLILFTPLWSLWFIGISVLERIKLNRRVGAFSKNSSSDLIHLYKFDEEAEDSRNLKRSLSFLSLSNNELLFENLEREISNQVNEQTDTLVESVFDAINSRQVDQSEGSPVQNGELLSKLHLNEFQLYIINQLNSLTWEKYPIIIRNTKATHACAIVRFKDPHFDEGKVVVAHFVKEVFQYH